jgi:hypothetical protein
MPRGKGKSCRLRRGRISVSQFLSFEGTGSASLLGALDGNVGFEGAGLQVALEVHESFSRGKVSLPDFTAVLVFMTSGQSTPRADANHA